MSSVIEKLDARGYWRVEVRPTIYSERHVESLATLRRAVEKGRVELRGWDFPHIDRDALPIGQNSIGSEIDWGSHVEIWRAFLSGQFVYRGGIWTDWLDQHHIVPEPVTPKTRMPIVSTLWNITEFFEFAARYSQTEAGADDMFVSIAFHGLKGRVLFGDHERRHWSRSYGPAQTDTFECKHILTRADLITNAARLAVACSIDMYALFGWETGPDLLDAIQAELLTFQRGA